MAKENRVQEIVTEALALAPQLLDGSLSEKDKLRLMRLVFEIAELALDMYEQYEAAQGQEGEVR